MSIKPRTFTTEELKQIGLADTSARVIKRTDTVEVMCLSCRKESRQTTMGQVMSKFKDQGFGWRCAPCFKQYCSEVAKGRTGEKNPFFGKKHTVEANAKRMDGYKKWASENKDLIKESAAVARTAFKQKYDTTNPMDVAEFKENQLKAVNTEKFKESCTTRNNIRYQDPNARILTGQKSKAFYDSPAGNIAKAKLAAYIRKRNLSKDSETNKKRIKNLLEVVKLTELELVQRLNEIHGEVYKIDFSTYFGIHKQALFIDKDYGPHWALVSNVLNGAGHPKRGLVNRETTYLQKYGVKHHMHTRASMVKVFKNRDWSGPEKKFAEMLSNRGFVYSYNEECGPSGKMWDFVIFQDENKSIPIVVIEIDGEYSHGHVTDPFGSKSKGYNDSERFQKLPTGVKYIQVDSKKIDLGFAELMRIFNIDYESWVQEMVNICTSMPFPYPKYSEDRMLKDWHNLCRLNDYSHKGGIPATSIINHFHKSIYSSRKDGKVSPVEAWNNKDLLELCIRNRFIYCSAVDITSMHIARGFEKNFIAPKVSVFRPRLAKYLLQKYAQSYNTIIDPFSGFSGRMLGAASLHKIYIGYDIRSETIQETDNIAKFLKLPDVYLGIADLMNQKEKDFEDAILFTCPPYGKKEQWAPRENYLETADWIRLSVEKLKCSMYMFVVDDPSGFEHLIAEEIHNRSHYSDSKEYVLIGTGEDFLIVRRS